MRKNRIQREKLDFLIAFGEALCNVDTSVELLRIQSVGDATFAESAAAANPSSIKSAAAADKTFDHVSHDFSFTLAEVVANELLAEESGSLALKSLYR